MRTTNPRAGPGSRTAPAALTAVTAGPWRRWTAVLRGPDWARTALLRRVAAGALGVLALVLLVVPDAAPAEIPVLVAARDLAPGVTVRAGDLTVRRWPSALAPAGALRAVPDADGRVLAGAVRSGEALTDLRLVGPQLAVRAGGPDAAAVPLRPADPAVTALLVPGAVVDVVAPGPAADPEGTGDGAARVVAERATVLSVLAAGPSGAGRDADGPLVLVALPRAVAAEVAAASLAGDLAVTLR